MVCFDASVLIDLFNERLAGPRRQRIDILMAELNKQKITIPAPAYIEFLTRSDKAREAYHAKIESNSNFRVEPLSKRASIECAILLDEVFSAKAKRDVTKTKLKFDWMIVAIAKTIRPTSVYSCDDDIVRGCRHAGLVCVNIDDIVIPPPAPSTMPLFAPLPGAEPA